MPSVFRKAGVVVVVVGSLAPSGQESFAQSLPMVEDSEAYAVYAALLQHRAKGDNHSTREVNLLQETRQPLVCGGKDRTVPPDWKPAIESFWQANAHRWLLKMGIDLGLPYSLITPPMVKAMVTAVSQDSLPRQDGGGWPGSRILPAVYVAVSAVGFNKDKTFALVGTEDECNVLSTTGDTIVCNKGGISTWEKVANAWRPAVECRDHENLPPRYES